MLWKLNNGFLVPDDGSGGGGSPQKDQPITIEIDGEEKTFTQDDITRVLGEHSTMSGKAEAIEKVLTAAGKYDLTPDEYVSQAENGFAVLNQLIEEGILDQQGNILKGKASESNQSNTTVQGSDGRNSSERQFSGADNAALKALESVNSKLASLEKQNSELQNDLTGMMRLRLQDKLQSQFPGLSEDDITRAFGMAMNDKSKSLEDHVKSLADSKAQEQQSVIADWAKKHNIDVSKIEELNALREQGAEGGAGALFQGKNFSFKKDKEGKTVTPKAAAEEFFKRKAELGEI